MKKIIKRIVDRIRFSYPIMIEESLTKILEEELPDFQRIDWIRLRDCFEKVSDGYISSHLFAAVKEYNSTLPPALKPLPKEMPEWFAPHMTRAELWDEVVNNYGTPEQKPSLPTVEELGNEMFAEWNKHYDFGTLAQKLHDKYSLHPREWWQDLKEGDIVKHCGVKFTVKRIGTCVITENGPFILVENCTPYTHPTADDIIKKHNLTEEEVKAIREGK